MQQLQQQRQWLNIVICLSLFFVCVQTSLGWMPSSSSVALYPCCIRSCGCSSSVSRCLMILSETASLGEGEYLEATTLEYSPNFHRHIIRNEQDGKVLESFPWLDQALQQYPTAKSLPLPWDRAQVAGAACCAAAGAAAGGGGGGGSSGVAGAASSSRLLLLPYPTYPNINKQEDFMLVREYLQTRLNWFPSQVEQLIRIYPSLVEWPVSVLKERIEFFLAPIPPRNLTYHPFSDSTTTTSAGVSLGPAPMDWPLVFYNHGHGAGMSVAQATHGLLTIPHVLMRVKLFPSSHDAKELDYSSSSSSTTTTPRGVSSHMLRRREERLHMHRKMVLFYQETPSVVIQMTSRQLSYFLQGAANLDCATYSYLHWKGWDFHQMYNLLQALPATLEASSDLDASLLENRGSEVTSTQRRSSSLTTEWLSFWHVRFQMRPIHIQAILKTHPRLSSYSTNQLLRNTQWLFQHLELDSSQIRGLLFRMPSLLGMSLESLQSRTLFWTQQVGLSIAELSQIVLEHPPLLQYSVSDNLQPKLDFFRNRLHLERDEIRSLTTKKTSCAKVWGRSLQGHLVPMAQGLVDAVTSVELVDSATMHGGGDHVDDPWREVGRYIIARSPDLLKYNWKRNLEPKVKYLLEQCGRPTARRVLLRTPRVLCQSFQHSLQPKLELLKKSQSISLTLLNQVPSLLLVSQKVLENRIQRVVASRQREHSSCVSDAIIKAAGEGSTKTLFALRRRQSGQQHQQAQKKRQSEHQHQHAPKKRTSTTNKRFIVCFDANNKNSKPVQMFPSVGEAASAAGVSRSTMYSILNGSGGGGHRHHHLKSYSYQWDSEGVAGKQDFTDLPSLANSSTISSNTTMVFSEQKATGSSTIRKRSKNDQAKKNILTVTEMSKGKASLAKDLLARISFLENDTLACPVEPKAEKSLTLFITARAFPSEYLLRGRRRSGGMAFHVPEFVREDWRKIVSVLWKGQKLQVLQDGKTLLLGYNYIRPSRPRCGLYAIREALRLARVWVDEELSTGRNSSTIPPITIITDSNYCLDQLGNETQILQWGRATSMESFFYNGAGPLHAANPDILYPLSRTYFRLVNECQVRVLFRKETLNTLGDTAHLAARLMYDSVK